LAEINIDYIVGNYLCCWDYVIGWLCCIDVGNVLAYISQWKANIGHRINASVLLMFAYILCNSYV